MINDNARNINRYSAVSIRPAEGKRGGRNFINVPIPFSISCLLRTETLRELETEREVAVPWFSH